MSLEKLLINGDNIKKEGNIFEKSNEYIEIGEKIVKRKKKKKECC